MASFIDAERALYPGSYVDLAPSFVWPSVTYVDTDRRAAQFFADEVENKGRTKAEIRVPNGGVSE